MQRYLELPVRGDKENDPAMPVNFCLGLVQARPDDQHRGTVRGMRACLRTYVQRVRELTK